MSIKNHMLAKQNRSSRQSYCVVTAKLHWHCSMTVGLVATGRVKTSTQILELSLARLISLLFLFISLACFRKARLLKCGGFFFFFLVGPSL